MRTTTLIVASAVSLVSVAGAALGQSATALWASNCASCHAADGSGGGAGTQTLLKPDFAIKALDRQYFDAIKNGVKDEEGGSAGMVAFGETLSDEQIWSLVVHIRELQAAAVRKKGPQVRPNGGVYASTHESYRVEKVAEASLEVPWSVDFLPTGEMLVANRGGELLVFGPDAPDAPMKVQGVPAVAASGQGGLMDVAPHPDFATNRRLLISYSHPLRRQAQQGGRSGGGAMTRLVSMTLKAPSGGDGAWTLSDETLLFEARPEHYSGGGLHFGCRIVFDPAGPVKEGPDRGKTRVFFAIGERGRGELAQNLARPNGKVFRVNDDGSIPADNPFAPGAAPKESPADVYTAIWSYGHRNPQGLTFDLAGNLWDTEHGPRGGDELNIIKPGRNYGWPVVSFGINYSDAPLKTPFPDLGGPEVEKLNILMPIFHWTPSIGACGLDTVRPGTKGEAFPNWRGDFVAGGLSGANVDRIRIAPDASVPGGFKVVERETIFERQGRVRDVVTGPDGSVYIVLNGPDRIVRLVPEPRAGR